MKRTLRKVVSTVLAATMLVGSSGFAGLNLQSVKADDSSTVSYINEKYGTVIGSADNYVKATDGYLFIKDAVLEGKDSSYSKVDKTNMDDQLTVNAQSVFTFIDKDGKVNEISNKNSDGTAKYNTIYGSISGGYYKYITVGKNTSDGEQVGLINREGEIVKLGSSEWYDNIEMYVTLEGERVYKLTSGNSFELVKEDGTLIYKTSGYNSVNVYSIYYHSNWNFDCMFMSIEYADHTILIDFSGKVWHEGSAKIQSTYQKSTTGRYVLVQYDDGTYGYYNYETGESKEGTGTYKIGSGYENALVYIVNGNQYDCYNRKDMKKLCTLEGTFSSLTYVAATNNGTPVINARVTSSTSMIYDIDGTAWFEHPVSSVSAYYSYDGKGIFYSYDDRNYYMTSDKKEYDITYLYNNMYRYVLNNIDKDEYGSYVTAERGVSNIGIGYRFQFSKKSAYVIATKSSGFKEFQIIEGNFSDRAGSFDYVNTYLPADIDIPVSDSETRHADYQLQYIYDLSGQEVVQKDMTDMNIYVYQDGRGNKTYYKADGTAYNLVDGELTESSDKYITYNIYDIGTTGYTVVETLKLISSNSIYGTEGYTFKDGNGNAISGKGIPELIANGVKINVKIDNINGKNIIRASKFGYVPVYYSINNTYRNEIYSYDGDVVATSGRVSDDNYGNIKQRSMVILSMDNAVIVYMPDKTIVKLKDLCKESIEDVVENTEYTIEKIDDISESVISGIKEETSVDKIKQTLGNADIKICDKNGEELATTEKVGTGSQIQLLKDGVVVDTAIVVVKGDTDGTGTIDVLDMETIQKSILGIGEGLAGAYKEAAHLTESKDISVLDMEAVQKDILGIQKIN